MMMLLSSGDGIACDLCGAQHRAPLSYYSIEFAAVSVVSGMRRPAGQTEASLDLCPNCWGSIAERIKQNYRAVREGVCCDLSGALMSGTYTYHVGKVTGVSVSRSGGKLQMTTDRDLVEIVLSSAMFQQLTSGNKEKTEWSASSAGL